MFKFVLPIASLIVGALIGSILTVNASLGIAKYLSIAILAAMDSVLGGARSLLEDTYDGLIMLSGFITNALLAMALAFLGTQIGIDMFMAATICFALRIFSNLAFIRRDIIQSYRERSAQKELPTIRFVKKPHPADKPKADADPANLENTITGLSIDVQGVNDVPLLPEPADVADAPVKVKAIVSSVIKPEKAEKTEKSEN